MRVLQFSANKCLLKVAEYSAQMENYPKAIEIYEQVSLSLSVAVVNSVASVHRSQCYNNKMYQIKVQVLICLC